MKRMILLLLFCSAMLSLPSGAKRLTQGFRVAKMELNFPNRPEWEAASDIEIRPILEQKYKYMGKGAQCYVFESEDGLYVVKLFRYDRFPSVQKVAKLFDACKMAYTELREETGLIYIHLNLTSNNLPILKCKDPIGRKFRFALDRYRFVVQKRALPFRKALELAKAKGEMKKRIDQFLQLLNARVVKEIRNSDPNLSRNFGFLEDRAVEFDFGNFYHSPGLNCAVERNRYALKLRHWLKKNAPEWVAYLDEQNDR